MVQSWLVISRMFDSQFLNHMYKIGSHYIENGSQIANCEPLIRTLDYAFLFDKSLIFSIWVVFSNGF